MISTPTRVFVAALVRGQAFGTAARLVSAAVIACLGAAIAVDMLVPAQAQNASESSVERAPPPPARAAPDPTRTANATPSTQPPAARRSPLVPAQGCGSPGALGVSRVVEIDTATGPKFGHQQHDVEDFLNEGEVVLTFDDGPLRPYTMPVLNALEAHCTKATFFIVGRMAVADPALVRETAQRGHTIGSHTWSHMDLRKSGPSRAKGEMELGLSAVAKALGTPVAPFFRFPYLSAPKSMADYAATRKLAVFSIDVDSQDYRTKDPAIVRRNVLAGLQHEGKGIILFHDIQRSTAGALKGLLDELKARGFKVVHVVAKGPATSLPEYDAMADRELARKSLAATDDPLATRSVVWPVTGGRPGGRAAARGPLPDDGDEVLPWGTVAVKPETVAPPQPKRRPPPPPKEDDDWSIKLFRF